MYEDSVCSDVCLPGSMPTESGGCTACELGTFNDVEAGGKCRQCPAGLLANGARTGCVGVCEAGSYPHDSYSYCELCGPGTSFSLLFRGELRLTR